MTHDVIEINVIPKEPKALSKVLNEARHQRYWGRIQRWVALNIAAWVMIIVFGGATPWSGAKSTTGTHHRIFIATVRR
jgi:hypothetical protein